LACSCAEQAKGAASAFVGVKLDDGAGGEALGLACGTGDGAVPHVDGEVALGEQPVVVGHPGSADDLAAVLDDGVDDGAVDVAAVDVELPEGTVGGKRSDVGLELCCGLFFGAVGWRDGAGEDEVGIEVGGDVALVAVEALALALSAVAHVGVLHRNAAIGSDTAADAWSAAGGIGLEILIAELP
jgi:hypothetical protein